MNKAIRLLQDEAEDNRALQHFHENASKATREGISTKEHDKSAKIYKERADEYLQAADYLKNRGQGPEQN